MKETELYQPVKNHLEKLGFLVRAEVRNCDLTATRGKELLIVELKTRFNLDLAPGYRPPAHLQQCLPGRAPPDNMGTRRWRGIMRLCRAGVGADDGFFRGLVDVVCDQLRKPAPDSGAHKLLLRKLPHGREITTPAAAAAAPGTAYREQALLVAQAVDAGLQRPGTSSPPARQGAFYTAKEYYRWFERAERGHYRLSDLGRQA